MNKLELKEKNYLVLTFHRPANMDEASKLKEMMTRILGNVRDLPVIFPIHPRKARVFDKLEIGPDHLLTVPPIGYLEFNYLVKHSMVVLMDSREITEYVYTRFSEFLLSYSISYIGFIVLAISILQN